MKDTAEKACSGIRAPAKAVAGVLSVMLGVEILNLFLMRAGEAVQGLTGSGLLVGIAQETLQAGIAIALYAAIFRRGPARMGIRRAGLRVSVRYFGGFAAIWAIVLAGYVAAVRFFNAGLWRDWVHRPVSPAGAFRDQILFQSFFPGFGEELLFRGLFVSVLFSIVLRGLQGRARFVVTVVVSAAIFSFAHVYFGLVPFRIIHADATQMAVAFACGIFYAFAYLKTGNLLAPFLAHNTANLSTTLLSVAIASF